jgi:hypothetical protein
MPSAPLALLIDDGELNAIGMLLWEMGMDPVWKSGAEVRGPLPVPSELLITTKKRSLEVRQLVPSLVQGEGPAWICVHNRDFPTLRDFLRELGFHFLVHSAADGPDTALLKLLFRQLSHGGDERRQALRLPCACHVTCSAGLDRFDGELCDLAADSCRIESAHDLRVGTLVAVYLPAELDPAAPRAYAGVVLRTQRVERAGAAVHALVVGFEEPQVRAQIGAILAGQGIGTRIVQLAPPPPRRKVPRRRVEIAIDEGGGERRAYARRVAFHRSAHDERPVVAMARELSPHEMRFDRNPELRLGSEWFLGLPRGKGTTPLHIEARVERDEGPRGLIAVFKPMSDARSRELQGLLEGLPAALAAELTESDLIHVGAVFGDEQKARKRR